MRMGTSIEYNFEIFLFCGGGKWVLEKGGVFKVIKFFSNRDGICVLRFFVFLIRFYIMDIVSVW